MGRLQTYIAPMTAASRLYDQTASHFRRIWADRHDQQGESTLRYRPGDVTDRAQQTRHSLRLLIGSMRRSKATMRIESLGFCETCYRVRFRPGPDIAECTQCARERAEGGQA